MSEASRNWDFSRLAYMDVVIMQIAIAEMLTFPNIPVSVTINEYVELAKLYSTPRSGGYINGMLDSIARHLIQSGKMMKEMPERPERQSMGRDNQVSGRMRFVHHDAQAQAPQQDVDDMDPQSASEPTSEQPDGQDVDLK